MKKNISIIITVIVFIIIILFIITPKKSFSYNENRYLTKFPKIDIDNILSGKFMTDLEGYITDHFPLRENMLGFKSKFYKTLGVKKQNDIYYGVDNKLYQEYKKPKNNDIIIKKINNFINATGVKVDFMLVPTSIYINSDKISKYNTNYDEGKTIDYFKENLNSNFIDVRKLFIDNKDHYLYYGTDHHWTMKGAYLAYFEYCNQKNIKSNKYKFIKVNKNFYGTLYSKVLDNSIKHDYIERIEDNTKYEIYYYDTKEKKKSFYNYDYLDKKDKYSFFLDNNHSLIEITNKDAYNGNSILVIKDSYANSFIPLLAPHYKTIYVIDPRYYNSSISDFVKEKSINNILFLYNVLTIEDDIGIVTIK